MKIVSLTSENVKRLKAVHIEPKGTLVTVGGKNDAGKSSVLDSIAYALGGVALIPAEPIRKGEAEARVELNLGQFVVTRRWWRDRVDEIAAGGQGSEFLPAKWGPTKTSLVIRNADGASYPSPQAMLDKLMIDLTFDPLEFARLKPAPQMEMLRSLVKLDTSVIDSKRRSAFERRTDAKKEHVRAQAVLNSMPYDEAAGFDELPATAVSEELKKAEGLRNSFAAAQANHQNQVVRMDSLQSSHARTVKKIKELEDALKAARNELKLVESTLTVEQKKLEGLYAVMDLARHQVPDFTVIEERLGSIADRNKKIRANISHREQVDKTVKLGEIVENLNREINQLDNAKEQMIAAVKFPVKGLAFGEDGVLFNGVPMEQASTSERVKISVAIGLALNPQLKVLLVRDGNVLDDDSIQQLAAQAEEAGAQVWMEYVTNNPDGVQVMIEDGAIQS